MRSYVRWGHRDNESTVDNTTEKLVKETAKRPDPAIAKQALKEAQARRVAQKEREKNLAEKPEINGRKGPDPARYGDWENKGITSDF
ncbi:MAG: DUF1674 domain-containing protein [Rhizobiaceae bacterium]|nr:DUF1674 domain-containing protein [Rhizobiaceae bacterium]